VDGLLEADLEHSIDAFDRALSDDEEFEAGLTFEWHATKSGDREAAAGEIRRRFGNDPARRRAALRVLAQME
jgi:hypothetical protein